MNIDLPGWVMEPMARSEPTAGIGGCNAGKEEGGINPDFLTALMEELQLSDCLDNGIDEQGNNQEESLDAEKNKEPGEPPDLGDEWSFSPCSMATINDPGIMAGALSEEMVSAGSEVATSCAEVPASSRDTPALSFPDGDENFIFAIPAELIAPEAPESILPETDKGGIGPESMAIRVKIAALSGPESRINLLPYQPDLPAPAIEKTEGPDNGLWEGRQPAGPDSYPETETDVLEPIQSENKQANLWPDFDPDTHSSIPAPEKWSGSRDPGSESAGYNLQTADAIKATSQYRAGEAARGSPVFENVFLHSTGEIVLDPVAENVAGSGRAADNLIDQIQSRLVYNAESGNIPGEIRVKLDPPRLGELLIRVVSWQGKISAEIVAETVSAKEILSSGLNELVQRLEQVNLQMERIDLYTAGEFCSGSGRFSGGNFDQEKPAEAGFQANSGENILNMPCCGGDLHQGTVNYWA